MANRGSPRDRGAFPAGCLLLLLLLAAAACGCAGTLPAPPDENVTVGTPTASPAETVTPLPAGHPRLYFTAEGGAALRERVDAEPYRSWFAGVRQLARETPFPDGPLLSQQDLGNGARALRTNAFVYTVSGDEEYGLRARGYLLTACTWPYWQDADRIAHGQTVSYMSGTFQGSVAETYDWISPLLTDEERATVQGAMLTKSLEPLIRQHGTEMEARDFGTNRIALAQGGVGLAAMVLKEDLPGNATVNAAETIVHDTLLEQYFNRFDRDGAWAEGIGYLSYGLANDAGGSGGIYYAEALRHTTGEDLFRHEKFSKSPGFLVYFLPPDRRGESGAFGDEDFSEVFRSAPAAALASRTGNPLGQWYYRNAPLRSPDPVGDILFSEPNLPEQSPESLPPSHWFPDAGWVALRTGWDADDTLVGFKAGPTTPGNVRPEKNSFLFDALGERLVILPGMSSEGYGGNYWDWYAATVGQNTILLDGDSESQEIFPPENASVITRFLTTEFYDQVQGSSAEVYGGKLSRFTRDLVFVKPEGPGYLVVYDDLAATRNVEFDFLLHALGKESITVTDSAAGQAAITRGNVTALVAVILPGEAAMSVQPGSPTRFGGSDLPTRYLQVATGPVKGTRFLVVLYPMATGSPVPLIERIADGDGAGVRIRQGETEDLLLFAHPGAGISGAGVTGDGSSAWVRLEGGVPSHFALVQGTHLAYQGRELFRSPVPASVADRLAPA